MAKNSWTKEEAEAAYTDPYNVQAMGIAQSLRPNATGAWGMPVSGANAQYAKYAGWSTNKIADDLRREGERNKAIDDLIAQSKAQPAASNDDDDEQEPAGPTPGFVGNMGTYPQLTPPTLPALPQGTLTLPPMGGGAGLQLPQMPGSPAPLGTPGAATSAPVQLPQQASPVASAATPAGGALNREAVMAAIQQRLATLRAKQSDPEWRAKQMQSASSMLTPKPVAAVKPVENMYPVPPIGMLDQ